MKKNLLAKVHYNEDEDTFELWLYDFKADEWNFSCSTPCKSLKGDCDTDYIHFSFLKEVLKCAELGYQIINK